MNPSLKQFQEWQQIIEALLNAEDDATLGDIVANDADRLADLEMFLRRQP